MKEIIENYIKNKKAELEAYEMIYEKIKEIISALHDVWEVTDKEEQECKWDFETHTKTPLFNEDGTPKMKKVYEYVHHPKTELDEDTQTKIDTCEKVLIILYDLMRGDYKNEETY